MVFWWKMENLRKRKSHKLNTCTCTCVLPAFYLEFSSAQLLCVHEIQLFLINSTLYRIYCSLPLKFHVKFILYYMYMHVHVSWIFCLHIFESRQFTPLCACIPIRYYFLQKSCAQNGFSSRPCVSCFIKKHQQKWEHTYVVNAKTPALKHHPTHWGMNKYMYT